MAREGNVDRRPFQDNPGLNKTQRIKPFFKKKIWGTISNILLEMS